jgi:hypothetical protein
MNPLESNIHSFIIKIWLEETAEEVGQAIWRGHITHVPSGERRYLQDLDSIAAFIAPYLEAIGAKIGNRWWMEDQLRRLGAYFGRMLSSWL